MGLSATAFRNRLVCLGALGAALLAATPGAAGERLVDLELVLAVDISGSVDDEEAVLQRDGFLAAITDAQVLAAIRAGYHGRIAVSYVEWAGDGQAETIGDWTEIHDETGARAFARGIEAKPVTVKLWTSISGVIAHAMAGFRSNGFRGKRRIIDIAGDGPNNRGTRVTVARDQAVAEGITINGLSIINGAARPLRLPAHAGSGPLLRGLRDRRSGGLSDRRRYVPGLRPCRSPQAHLGDRRPPARPVLRGPLARSSPQPTALRLWRATDDVVL